MRRFDFPVHDDERAPRLVQSRRLASEAGSEPDRRARLCALLDAGDLRGARIGLEAALGDPALRSPAMLALAAKAARAAGRDEEAFARLREAYDLDPANAEVARGAFDHAPADERGVWAERLLALGPVEAARRPAALAALLETAPGIVWLTQMGASVAVDVAARTDGEIDLRVRRRTGETTARLRRADLDLRGGVANFDRGRFDFGRSDFVAVDAPEGFIVFGSPALRVPPAASPALTLRGAPVCVVAPLYRDDPSFRACVEALLADADFAEGLFDVILVDDSGESALADYARYESAGCRVLANPVNLGFVGAVNHALSRLGDIDVVLLNADTTPPPGLARRLREVAARDASVGLVTALSNNAEYGCFPRPFEANSFPAPAEALALDAGFAALHGADFVETPAATGFCLLITAACRRAVGLLDPAFRRGYLEDVDYCLRARRAGLRCVCALGVYVAHEGSTSFGPEKKRLVQRNARALLARHPQFQTELAAFRARNIWNAPFARAEAAFWPRLRIERLVVVGREMLRAPGFDRAAIVNWLGPDGLCWCEIGDISRGGCDIAVWREDGAPPQSLRHRLPPDASPDAAQAWLATLDVGEAIFLDPAATPMALADAIRGVAAQWSLAAVDLGLICPRGSAHLPNGRFCAIPEDVAACEACVERAGATGRDGLHARAYRQYWSDRLRETRSARFIDAQAQTVIQTRIDLPPGWRPSRARPRPPTAAAPRRCAASGFAFLATRGRLGSLRAFAALLRELDRLDRRETQILLAGAPLALEGVPAGRVDVIAPVGAADVVATLERLDIGRVFVVDREAAVADPLIDAVVASGRLVGGYRWGGVGAAERVGDLLIDGFAPMPWAARMLARWRSGEAAR